MRESASNLRRAVLGVSCLCLALAGCGGGSSMVVKKEEIDGQKPLVDPEFEAKQQEAARVAGLVKAAEAKFSSALEANLAFYAPETFIESQNGLAKLRELYKNYDPNSSKGLFGGVSEKDLRTQGETVENLINRGFETKRLVDLHLGEAINQVTYLASLDIPVALRSGLDSLRKELNELVLDIEDEGEFKSLAGDRAKLLERLHAFEVKAMLAIHVEPLNKELAQLDRNKIPKSVTNAKNRVESLATVIQARPRATDEILAAKAEAVHGLRVAATVYGEVEQMRGRSAEDVVTWYRSGVDKIARTLANTAFDDQPFEQDTASVIAAVQALQEQALATAKEEGRAIAAQESGRQSEADAARATEEAAEKHRLEMELAEKRHALAVAELNEKQRAELAQLAGDFAAKEARLLEQIRRQSEQIIVLGGKEGGAAAAEAAPATATQPAASAQEAAPAQAPETAPATPEAAPAAPEAAPAGETTSGGAADATAAKAEAPAEGTATP